jgi:ribosomal protein S8E
MFNLDLIRVTKNPNGPMFTSLDVITKLNHNWSENVMCVEKYAQVTNNSTLFHTCVILMPCFMGKTTL